MARDHNKALSRRGRWGDSIPRNGVLRPRSAAAPFGLAVALAQLRFGLYSSPDGPYITGTGTLFRRR
jgi:hypothetical protein